MSTQEKIRENGVRRAATRQGLELCKSRGRDPQAWDYGTFMLVNPWNSNGIVADDHEQGYGWSLDDIEDFLKSWASA